MSSRGSYSSTSTDAYTNGLNPMYQSLTTQAQSEYDVIHESQTCLIKPPLPKRVTTTNSLYASRQEIMRHPCLKHPSTNTIQSDIRFTAVPASKPYVDRESGQCSSGGCGSCFVNTFIYLSSCVSIILSVAVIVLCLLHWTSVFSIIPSSSNSTIISPSTGRNNNTNNTSNNNNSTNMTNITNMTNVSMMCNCSSYSYIIENYTQLLEDIKYDLGNISLELMSVSIEFSSSSQLDSVRLANLSSRIHSINDSIQQLTIQATNTCSILSKQHSITEPVLLDDLGNQTCPPNVTNLHQDGDITIDISNECTVRLGPVCNLQPGLPCTIANVIPFVMDEQILVDFTCYAEFVFSPPSPDAPANATTVIRQESFVNTTANQNIFNDVLNTSNHHVVGCYCLSFDTEILICRYLAKHCDYNKETYNSTISIIG